jgi:hypothetical protein
LGLEKKTPKNIMEHLQRGFLSATRVSHKNTSEKNFRLNSGPIIFNSPIVERVLPYGQRDFPALNRDLDFKKFLRTLFIVRYKIRISKSGIESFYADRCFDNKMGEYKIRPYNRFRDRATFVLTISKNKKRANVMFALLIMILYETLLSRASSTSGTRRWI